VNFQLLDSLNYFYESDIINYEVLCAKLLNYDLCQYTSYRFLKMFCSQGIIFDNELNKEKGKDKDHEIIKEGEYSSPGKSPKNEKGSIASRSRNNENTDYNSNSSSDICTNTNISPKYTYNSSKSSNNMNLVEKIIKSCYDVNDFILEGIFLINFIFIFIKDNSSLEYSPLHIALTAISITRKLYNLPNWHFLLEKMYKVTHASFQSCYDFYSM